MKKKSLILAGAICLTAFGFHRTNVDDRIWYFVHDLVTSEETKKTAIWLPEYQAEIVAYQLPEIIRNASGITYDKDDETLWVITNNPTSLFEFDLEFNFLRKIELTNFTDTESVSYAGDDHLVFTDERDQTITIAPISNLTTNLDKEILRQISLNLYGYSNSGLEGIAVDQGTNSIYAVREKDPLKILKVTGFIEDDHRIGIENFDTIDVNDLYLEDFSGLHFDPETNHLLILSDQSRLLAEVDLDGHKISYMELERGFNGLDLSITQAEGVTMDDKGYLYIVSEPNYVYRYKNSPR